MAVKLRLRRLGRSHHAYFQIVAADARSPRDGKFIEKIGTYDPHLEFDKVLVDQAKALKWLKNGAQPTDTVRSILSNEGVMLQYHLLSLGKSEQEVEAEYNAWKIKRDARAAAEKSAILEKRRKKAEAALAQEREVRKARAEKLAAARSAAPASEE